MRKLSVILILLTLFLTLSTSHHYEFPDETADYGDYASILVECDDNAGTCAGGLSYDHEIHVCGELAGTTTGEWTGDTDYHWNVQVPEDAECDPGSENELTFEPDTTGMHSDSGGSLTIESNPNARDNFEVAINARSGTDQLRGLGLTNEPYDNGVSIEDGDVVWTYNQAVAPGNGRFVFESADAGKIVSPGQDLSEFIADHQESWDYFDWEQSGVLKSFNGINDETVNSFQDYSFNRNLDEETKRSECDDKYSCTASYFEEDAYSTTSFPNNEVWHDLHHWDLKAEVLVLDEGFHMCAESEHGAVREAGGQSYECTSSTDSEGEWQEYEEDDSSCEAGHVGYEEIGGEERIVAYYGQEDCEYDTIHEWDWAVHDGVYSPSNVDDPVVHTCHIQTDLTVYSDTLPNEECMHHSNWDDQWIEAGEMPHVRFGAYREHFEALLENNEVYDTEFVHSDTGWQTQIQPLHEAELKYSNPGNALNPQWWNGLNMTNVGSESSETKYYDEESAEDHYIGGQAADPWIPANAGSHSNAVNDDSSEFEGGFAGNCDGGLSWQYQDDADPGDHLWECGGIGDEEETWFSGTGSSTGGGDDPRPVLPIPDFNTVVHLPGTSVDNGEREIGLVLFGFENLAEGDRDSYVPDVGYYSDVSDGGGELTHAAVRCWAGSFDDKPTNADGEFVENQHSFAEYTSITTNQPNSISQTVNTEGLSGYACEWAYETSDEIGEDGDALARGQAEDVIALHQSQHSSDWDAVSNEFDLNDGQFPNN